mmetsp:Transcript_3952/g.8867  ORF Transcript_3952/g.8867 Transcript_3952/m.8867 type:complete len:205 (-) Transcript_3952:780-1394(-)
MGRRAGAYLWLHINMMGRRRYVFDFPFFDLEAPGDGMSARMMSTSAAMEALASAPSTSSKIMQFGLPPLFPLLPPPLLSLAASPPPKSSVELSIALTTRSVSADAVLSSLAFTSMGRYPACLHTMCASVDLPTPGGPDRRRTRAVSAGRTSARALPPSSPSVSSLPSLSPFFRHLPFRSFPSWPCPYLEGYAGAGLAGASLLNT